MTNEYKPWEDEGITELEYFKKAYLELRKEMYNLSWQEHVEEFHSQFSQAINPSPTLLDKKEIELRRSLIFSEALEIDKALEEGDLPGIADGCADLIYVTLGLAVACGIDLTPVWNLVHTANMKKVGGGKSELGKVLKPKGWQDPDIISEIKRQINATKDK